MSTISSRFSLKNVPTHLSSFQQTVREEILLKIKNGRYTFVGSHCPVCEEKKFKEVSEIDSFGIPTPVVLCRNCGLLQTNPHFDDNSYSEFYQSDFFRLYKNMEEPTDEYLFSKKKAGEKIYNYLKINGMLPATGSVVLEVGCGTGAALSYFHEIGYEVVGCDLSRTAIEKGKSKYNFDLLVGKLGDINLQKKPDLIIYCHVFEHITEPYKELEQLAKIVKEQTKIYVEMPGLKKNYGDKLKFFKGAHVFHFSLKTLENMMGKAKFSLVVGDESIRSIFKFNPQLDYKIKNDFHSSNYYLSRSEVTFSLKTLVKKILKRN